LNYWRHYFTAILFCVCQASLCLAGDPRVAVMPSGDEKAGAIVELMQAELAQRDDVILLERKEIDKVLAEHRLQFDGLLSMNDALKVGALLGCDIFAELHVEPADGGGAEITSLVAFDSLTGIRLYDGALAIGRGLDDRAKEAVRALSSGLMKWKGNGTVPVGRTLSIVSIRHVGLPDSLKHLPESLALLLERRLVNTTDIAIVERKRLAWINKESTLTGLRRDRLLASCVLVDLEVSKGATLDAVTVNALLTDGTGQPLGQVLATNSVGHAGNLVDALSRELLCKLKLVPPEDVLTAAVHEAERFLDDAKRLVVRGQKAGAEVSETAAHVLAESLLSREPHRVEFQKFLVRLHQHMARRMTDPEKVMGWLERDLGFTEAWPSAPDMGVYIGGCTEMFHQLLTGAGVAPDAERMRSLRLRFGAWCKKIADKTPACIGDMRSVEAWSLTADDFLANCALYIKALPDGFAVSRYTASTNYLPFDAARHLFPVERFTAAEKNTLNRLYEGWGSVMGPGEETLRRMQSYIAAAMLVNSYPVDFAGTAELITRHLHAAADVVLEDPSLCDAFLDLCEARGRRPPAAYRPLPLQTVVGAVRRLESALDESQIACPLLLEYLDEHDADQAEYPGAYLRRAWEQLLSPGYAQPKGDVYRPRYTDWYVERIRASYHARYGGQVDQSEPGMFGETVANVSMPAVKRLFEFETAPGISSLDSAELSGDRLYLLCLHADPRTYALCRVDLDVGKTTVLGELVTDWVYQARSGNEISVGDGTVYVPTEQGVICFARDSTNVWTITEESGLPAARVTACAEADGLLYLGCRGRDEGYVVRCNPQGEAMQMLACSGRKTRESGLDDSPPYTIESIVRDVTGKRLFLTAVFPASDEPWLWACDLKSGTLKPVHKRPYPASQLRTGPNGQLLIQIAERRLGSSEHGVRGYALWDPATYAGDPVNDLKDAVWPLMGSVDPDRALIRYSTPSFNGRLHTMPGTVSAVTLLSDLFLVASEVRPSPASLPPITMLSGHAGFGRAWQIIPRSDTDRRAVPLPLLDDEAPFMVRSHGEHILAVTQGGAWLLTPVLPAAAAIAKAQADMSDTDAGQGRRAEGTGALVVEAPLGSTVMVDNGPAYRVWKDGRLSWKDLQAGRHEVGVAFVGREAQHAADVVAGETATLRESVGEDRCERRTLDLGDGCSLDLVRVPPAVSDRLKQGKIAFGDGFWIGRYEVTQAQYMTIMGNNPSAYLDDRCPVEQVGRAEAQEFCARLTAKCGSQMSGLIARLPSEQEWAYARQAGAVAENGVGDAPDELLRAGWLPENSDGFGHPVGQKMPNRFWLYDMNGNVAEWCEWGDPQGGSWRSSGRSPSDGVGFRVLVTHPDSELGKTNDGWLYLTHVEPVSARIGWGTFRRWKQRDAKPGIGGTQFETVMYVHANSSLKYKLGGQYQQFIANYGMWTGAHGVCRFVVLADGKERFRSKPIYGTGSTSVIGINTPVELDVTGVDMLELRTVKAEGKSLSNACGLWGDAKIK